MSFIWRRNKVIRTMMKFIIMEYNVYYLIYYYNPLHLFALEHSIIYHISCQLNLEDILPHMRYLPPSLCDDCFEDQVYCQCELMFSSTENLRTITKKEIERFWANNDTSSVSIKRFDSQTEDSNRFPTFSIRSFQVKDAP